VLLLGSLPVSRWPLGRPARPAARARIGGLVRRAGAVQGKSARRLIYSDPPLAGPDRSINAFNPEEAPPVIASGRRIGLDRLGCIRPRLVAAGALTSTVPVLALVPSSSTSQSPGGGHWHRAWALLLVRRKKKKYRALRTAAVPTAVDLAGFSVLVTAGPVGSGAGFPVLPKRFTSALASW